PAASPRTHPDAVAGSLVDAPALPRLEHHLEARLGAHRVGDRPPTRSLCSPDVEGMVDRALDQEGHTQRLDHRRRRREVPWSLNPEAAVFSARSLKWAAAVPQ